MELPAGCPGSSQPATKDDPDTCHFTSSYAGTAWRIFPGLYPGGLKLLAGDFYLEPGIYYLGGGGFDAGGNGTIIRSVAASTTTKGGGILLFNSELPDAPIGPITLNGASADIDLLALDDGSRWDGLVIFQDRDFSVGNSSVNDVVINGGASELDVSGTIYIPTGDILVNGGTGQILTDQVIASTYEVLGNEGTIFARNREDHVFKLSFAGLVE